MFKHKAQINQLHLCKLTFDIEWSNRIFDIFLEARLIKVHPKHKMPSKEELWGRDYCKWHNSYSHATKNGITFRNSEMLFKIK